MKEIKALRRQVRKEAKGFKSEAAESVSRLDMEKEIRQEKRSAIRARREEEKELRTKVFAEAKEYKTIA